MQIDLFGVPSNAGALHPGTESAPSSLRRAGIQQRFLNRGFQINDHGDLISGVGLPRHNDGAVRNWPAPRLAWDELTRRAAEIFHPDRFSVLMGGDCSMVVGTFAGFRQVFGDNAHLLVLDGQIDIVSPRSDCCIGAAAMGLWFLTKDNGTWWQGKPVKPSAVTVIGPREIPQDASGISIISAEALEQDQTLLALKTHLASLPSNSRIFVHLDVDVMNDQVMPAAYSPNASGIGFELIRNITRVVFSDPRVKGIELAEYCPIKDPHGKAAEVILGLLDEIPVPV